MSKYATWMLCSDGFWYKDPVWSEPHNDGGLMWMIVLDDDDPPEFVRRHEKNIEPPEWFFKETAFKSSYRMLGRRGKMEFKDALACFGVIAQVPPPPQESDGRIAHDESRGSNPPLNGNIQCWQNPVKRSQ